MSKANRRTFLKQAAGGIAGVVALGTPGATGAAGANGRIVLAAIGCGGRGRWLAKMFSAQKGIRIAYVCDPDDSRSRAAAKVVAKTSGEPPAAIRDMRRAFDDRSVDAVVIATPDHWHAPATLLALAADKHVYVEKPCGHNIREGRWMLTAARRAKRVVQVGTQSRSIQHVRRAMELLHNGAIGDILVAKAWNSQKRANIGHASASDPPEGFDYDLWLGPAPYVPFQSNRHHYTWHWWYDFGTGDIGNDGVHDIDIARWGLGVDQHPATVTAMGGKYYFDDDQQFPDTQYVLYEYPGDGKIGHKKQLVFEQRIWSPYVQEGHENGNAFYGTKGMMTLGKKDGWRLYGPGNELRESMPGVGLSGDEHCRDFLEAVRTGKHPSADIEIGHMSAALSHLGNIASRVGRVIRFDPATERITGDSEANRLVGRAYRKDHWATPKEA